MTLRIVAVVLTLAPSALFAQHYQTDFPAEEFRARGTRRSSSRSAPPPSPSCRACAQTEGLHASATAQHLLLPVRHRNARRLPAARRPHEEGDASTCRRAIRGSKRPRAACCRPRMPSSSRASPARTRCCRCSRWSARTGRWLRGRRRGAAVADAASRRPRSIAEFSPAENQGQSRGELVSAETARVERLLGRSGFAPAAVRRAAARAPCRAPSVRNLNPILDEMRSDQEPARDRDGAARVADRRPRPDGGDAQHRARRHRVPARRGGALRLPRSTTRGSRAIARSPRPAPRTSTTCTTSATPRR